MRVVDFLLICAVLAAGFAWLPDSKDTRWLVLLALIFVIAGWRDVRDPEWRLAQARGWREFWSKLGWLVGRVIYGAVRRAGEVWRRLVAAWRGE